MPVHNNIFSQMNTLFRLQKPNLSVVIDVDIDSSNIDEKMQKITSLFTIRGLDQLSSLGLDVVIDRTVERLQRGAGPLLTATGHHENRANALIPQIAAALKTKKRMSPGRYGFATTSKLDRILITDKHTNSPYVQAWQIAEFGTGIFAEPEKRLPGDGSDTGTKVPGGGGAWYLSPKRKSPIILGSTGSHFLFGERQTTEEVRADIDEVVKFLAAHIRSVI
jgi:hypothetical protein